MASEADVPIDAPSDVPIFKYPPFPPGPDGVKIIPFKDFKPSGIKIFLDPSPDNIEVDGTGLPTAQLNVRHIGASSDRRKKKKRMGEDEEGVVRRYLWWDEWEKDEANRTTAHLVDASFTDSDRLIQATHDFRTGRIWPTGIVGLQPLFDSFRLYVGLLSHQPQHAKKRASPNDASDGEDQDLDDEEVNPIEYDDKPRKPTDIYSVREPEVGGGLKKASGADQNEEDEQWARREEEANERRVVRMIEFLDDPEKTVAVFFSSYYREKGLIWSETRCRDGPLLLTFFLTFLLRNKVFSDPSRERGLKRALDIVSLAKKELPASFIIAKSLPDAFSDGCRELWGSKIETIKLNSTPADAKGEKLDRERPDSKKQKLQADGLDDAAAEVIAEIEEEIIDVEKMKPTGWGTSVGTGFGLSGDWGDTPKRSWVDAEETTTAWGGGATWDISDIPSLLSLMGPTSLPLTHATGVVESSTRKIVAIMPPRQSATNRSFDSVVETVEFDMESRFGKMVLAPWLNWGKHEMSDITMPAILSTSRDEVTKFHDPLKDDIVIFVEPPVLDKLIVGMGLGATWIQIARIDQGGKPIPGAPSMWYMEQLMQIISSYYTDR